MINATPANVMIAMPNELPLPDELLHLLEKRTGDDRRQSSEDNDVIPGIDVQQPTANESGQSRRKSQRRKR